MYTIFMEQIDARSLSPKAQERIRQLAIKAVLKGAMHIPMARFYGVTCRAKHTRFSYLKAVFNFIRIG
jgi:hypothetical protein